MWRRRIARPAVQELDLEDQQGAFGLTIDFRSQKYENVTIDVYTVGRAVHPDNHLGYWTLPLDRRRYEGVLQIDFRTLSAQSVRYHLDRVDGREDFGAGETLVSSDYWVNPACPFAPVRDLMIVTRGRDLQPVETTHVYLKDDDPSRVKKFYQDLHSNHAYQEATGTNPFLSTLHETKMEDLVELWETYFAGRGARANPVVDVGCGRCLLSEVGRDWSFDVYALDFGEGILRERQAETPSSYHWLASDVSTLPFASESFGGLFAGEVIEHVPDPATTLREWFRVLRPGGVAIITTPNLARLSNRMGGSRTPFAPDHLSELTHDELRQVIDEAGFELLELRGFYLEACLRRLGPGQWIDRLQAEWNLPEKIPLMRRLGRLGRRVPALSFGLIAVARRPGTAT